MAHVRKQMISFFMTTKCNLACKYCYTPKLKNLKKEDQQLSLKFAKKGIDDFFRDSPSRYIRFYGIGEPTLEIEKIKKICEYAREKAGDKLFVELQTNGCFSKSVRDWISKNVNVLWVSCDGPAEVQDAQRPTRGGKGTSKLVVENLTYLNQFKNIQVGVRATLTDRMIERQEELVDYFHSLGIKYVNVLPAFSPVEGSEGEKFTWDPIKFAQNFLKAHKKAEKLGLWYNTMCIVNFDEPTRHACRSCTPCPHLTTDDYISCCDFAQLGPEYENNALQQLIYGKYDEKTNTITYNEDKIAKIRHRCAEELEKTTCKGCKYIRNCAGGCLGQVVNETGDLMGKCEQNCQIVNYLAKRMPRNKKLHPAFHS